MNEKWKNKNEPFENPLEILKKLDELKDFLKNEHSQTLEKIEKMKKIPLVK